MSAVPLDGSLAGTLRRLRAAIEEDAANAPAEVLHSDTARTGPLLARARAGLAPRPRKGD